MRIKRCELRYRARTLRHGSFTVPFKTHDAVYPTFISQHIISEKPSAALGLFTYSGRLAEPYLHKQNSSGLEIGRGLLQESPVQIHPV